MTRPPRSQPLPAVGKRTVEEAAWEKRCLGLKNGRHRCASGSRLTSPNDYGLSAPSSKM